MRYATATPTSALNAQVNGACACVASLCFRNRQSNAKITLSFWHKNSKYNQQRQQFFADRQGEKG
jgi:hypothetical protein